MRIRNLEFRESTTSKIDAWEKELIIYASFMTRTSNFLGLYSSMTRGTFISYIGHSKNQKLRRNFCICGKLKYISKFKYMWDKYLRIK